MVFLATEVVKWKHISPLTATVDLTLWVELLMMLCGVEVDPRGVPKACCFLSEIRLNQAAVVHTHAWEKPRLPVTEHNLWALLCSTESRCISYCRIKFVILKISSTFSGGFHAAEYLLTAAHCTLMHDWPLGMKKGIYSHVSQLTLCLFLTSHIFLFSYSSTFYIFISSALKRSDGGFCQESAKNCRYVCSLKEFVEFISKLRLCKFALLHSFENVPKNRLKYLQASFFFFFFLSVYHINLPPR